MMYPTKSVPGGCLVGLFGLLAWAYCGVSCVLIWKAWHTHSGIDTSKLLKMLYWHAAISFAAGLGLLWLGRWMFHHMELCDSTDPKQPSVKF